MSISYYKVADIHLHNENFQQGLEGYESALNITEKLANQSPTDAILQDDLSYYRSKIADTKKRLK